MQNSYIIKQKYCYNKDPKTIIWYLQNLFSISRISFMLFHFFPKRFQQAIDTCSIKNRGVVSYSFIIYLFTNYLTGSSNLFVERHFLSRFLDCISLEEISTEIEAVLSVGVFDFYTMSSFRRQCWHWFGVCKREHWWFTVYVNIGIVHLDINLQIANLRQLVMMLPEKTFFRVIIWLFIVNGVQPRCL